MSFDAVVVFFISPWGETTKLVACSSQTVWGVSISCAIIVAQLLDVVVVSGFLGFRNEKTAEGQSSAVFVNPLKNKGFRCLC